MHSMSCLFSSRRKAAFCSHIRLLMTWSSGSCMRTWPDPQSVLSISKHNEWWILHELVELEMCAEQSSAEIYLDRNFPLLFLVAQWYQGGKLDSCGTQQSHVFASSWARAGVCLYVGVWLMSCDYRIEVLTHVDISPWQSLRSHCRKLVLFNHWNGPSLSIVHNNQRADIFPKNWVCFCSNMLCCWVVV